MRFHGSPALYDQHRPCSHFGWLTPESSLGTPDYCPEMVGWKCPVCRKEYPKELIRNRYAEQDAENLSDLYSKIKDVEDREYEL